MTVIVQRPRRSTRNERKKTQYKDISESEDSGSEYEEERHVTSKKRTQKQGNKNSKRFRNDHRISRKTLEQLESEIEENVLYKALASPDVDIKNLALEWMEDFVEEKQNGEVGALTVMINLILRSCGCLHLFQQHDLVNLDSAPQTIGELVIAFTNQKSHKFPFKSLPDFKKHVLEFFEEVIQVAHEKDELYKSSDHIDKQQEDESSLSSFLMSHILTWISSLSSCTVRPLRYTSTVLSLVILNKLCDIIKQSISSLDKAQRQLTTAKRNSRNKSKVETLNKTINNCHTQKNTIIEYFNDISNITLGHRYRDIDASVRQECVKYLCQSMIKYPEYFFQANFLRYFGWLLSDPSNHVRNEVSRVLLKLYRNASSRDSTMGIGFRQFTERYKKQLTKMCAIDTDHNVRLCCLSVCCELLKIGFMDEEDTKEIISIYSSLVDGKSALPKTINEKLKFETARFVNIVNSDNVKNDIEKYSIFIKDFDFPLFGNEEGKLSFEECLKYKNLISILESSLTCDDTHGLGRHQDIIISMFHSLSLLPYYSNSWEFLIRYLLCDTSSINITPKESNSKFSENEIDDFKSLLDISSGRDKMFLMSFICASVSSSFDSRGKSSKDEQQFSSIMVKLVKHLPLLQKISIRSYKISPIFVQLWYLLVKSNDENMNILTFFKNLGQTDTYVDITNNLLEYFEKYTSSSLTDDSLMEKYDVLFGRLFATYNTAMVNSTDLNIINTEIRLRVNALVQNVVLQAQSVLLRGQDTSFDSESDSVASVTTKGDLGDQLNLIKTFSSSITPLLKLRKLADHININEALTERVASLSIIEVIHFKILDKLDFSVLIEQWPKNLQKISSKLIENFKIVFDLLIVYNSWKLEELIFAPDIENNSFQNLHDIPALLGDTNTSLNLILKLLNSLDMGINSISERIGSTFTESVDDGKILLQNLMDLKALISSKFIDLIMSMKIFYTKFKGKNNFKDFEVFFNRDEGLSVMVREQISPDIQKLLLNSFLYREAKLAKVLRIELEREDEESVNFEDWVETGILSLNHEKSKESLFDSDDEEVSNAIDLKSKKVPVSDETIENLTWSAEKDLCVYSVKLLGLVDTSLVDDHFSSRMRLNVDKLGQLFSKLMEQKNAESVEQQNVASNDV